MSEYKRIILNLPLPLHEALVKLAEENGSDVSTELREAADTRLRIHGVVLPREVIHPPARGGHERYPEGDE